MGDHGIGFHDHGLKVGQGVVQRLPAFHRLYAPPRVVTRE